MAEIRDYPTSPQMINNVAMKRPNSGIIGVELIFPSALARLEPYCEALLKNVRRRFLKFEKNAGEDGSDEPSESYSSIRSQRARH